MAHHAETNRDALTKRLFAMIKQMDDIDTFINNLNSKWQKETCIELLALQGEVSDTIEKSIKWGNPYFSYNGKALLKWYCAKDWINVYFFKGVLLKDSEDLFIATDNHAMRTIKIFENSNFNKSAYCEIVKQAINLNS